MLEKAECPALGLHDRALKFGFALMKDYLPSMELKSPRSQKPMRLAPQSGAPMFLWILVGVMTAIELILSLSSFGLFASQNLRWPAFVLGAFWKPLLLGMTQPVYPGQSVLMFITHAFLHGGLAHLAMNGVVLLSLGKFVSANIGTARTLLVLFVSAVVGGACFGLLSSGTAPMIGASGAVFGLIGVWQAADYQMRRRSGLPLQPLFMAIMGLVAANIALFVIFYGGLAWEAHLGGWLAGWLAGQTFARH